MTIQFLAMKNNRLFHYNLFRHVYNNLFSCPLPIALSSLSLFFPANPPLSVFFCIEKYALHLGKHEISIQILFTLLI